MTDPLIRRYAVNMAALDPPRPVPPPRNSSFEKDPAAVFKALSRPRRAAFRQSSGGETRKFSFRKLEKDKRSKSFSDIRSTGELA